jgi:hypothetical protein
MARPGPRRRNTVVRMSDEQGAAADARAIEDGFTQTRDGRVVANRSELVRLALDYALIHMPRGWRPPRPPDEGPNAASTTKSAPRPQ